MKGLGVEGHWIGAHDGDRRALGLFKEHYSYRRRASGQSRGNSTFVGQGEKIVLMTVDCRALFVWQFSTVERIGGQEGVRCSVFRNLTPILSSELILEAEQLAWQHWPGERLFTYVNPGKIRSVNPGCCFKKAGWKRCGTNTDGHLIILEKLP